MRRGNTTHLFVYSSDRVSGLLCLPIRLINLTILVYHGNKRQGKVPVGASSSRHRSIRTLGPSLDLRIAISRPFCRMTPEGLGQIDREWALAEA